MEGLGKGVYIVHCTVTATRISLYIDALTVARYLTPCK